MCSEVQCVCDYVDLVCIRVLSGDIRQLLYCELLRCSGIHLDESVLMTELCRDGAHLNNYCSSLIKGTTSRDLLHALFLSLSLPLCYFPSYPFWVFLFLALFAFTFALSSYILLYITALLLFNCHLPLAIRVTHVPGIPSVTDSGLV